MSNVPISNSIFDLEKGRDQIIDYWYYKILLRIKIFWTIKIHDDLILNIIVVTESSFSQKNFDLILRDSHQFILVMKKS